MFVRLFCYVEAVDCAWGEYGEWSTCTAACGGGTKIRTRPKTTPASNGGAPCTGSATETETCNHDACQGDKLLNSIPNLFIITKVQLITKMQNKVNLSYR